jgi:hypothetical protein
MIGAPSTGNVMSAFVVSRYLWSTWRSSGGSWKSVDGVGSGWVDDAEGWSKVRFSFGTEKRSFFREKDEFFSEERCFLVRIFVKKISFLFFILCLSSDSIRAFLGTIAEALGFDLKYKS